MAAARRETVLPFQPVGRETVQERVYRRLVAMILDCDIEPGRTVTIAALAEAFGVSTMPVREALQRLTTEGALTVIAGRSVGIPPLSVQRLLDLKRVRMEVEGLAVEWATGRVMAPVLARLDTLIEVMSHSIPSDSAAFMPANREFHFTVYAAAGSPALLSIIENLWLQVGPYFGVLRGSGNWRFANHQHQALRDALAAADAIAARNAIRGDIEEAAAILERLLRG